VKKHRWTILADGRTGVRTSRLTSPGKEIRRRNSDRMGQSPILRNGRRQIRIEELLMQEVGMGFEIVYGVGALVLLTALIFGVLQYHFRNRSATRVGGEISHERYERNET
jgi:hypothetical protein